MKSKLESLFVIIIMLLSIANIKFCADAIISLNDNTEKRYISQSDIKSNQYLVTDEYIARISPKTMVESFVMQMGLEDKEIAIYEDETKEVEVKEGLISTGMIMTVSEKEEIEEVEQELENIEEEQEIQEEIQENGDTKEKIEEDYKLSVVGDTNKDGNANIVEVVQIINHLAGFEGKEITGIELVSSDVNGDSEVNLIDIDKLIRYIVFEELEIGEVGAPKEPIIELEGEEIEGWYKGDVKVSINTQEEEFLKTVYTIDEERKETTNKIEEETIRQNGEHKIQAYTYGKNESKSIIAEKEVKIDKEAAVIKSINKSTEEETHEAVRVEIIAEDNQSGLAEEAYSFDGGATWQKENYKEYTTNQEQIKIQVKDKVGNIREETINIQNIVQEKTKYKVLFKNYNGTTLQEEELEEGSLPEYKGETPSKAEDNTYTYEFAGWDKEVTEVRGNAEYTATYTKELINYTIEYELNGGKVETENPITYNAETESFTLNNPSKKWYRFTGWTLNEETQIQENVTIEKGSLGNRKYTANWELEKEAVKIKETDKVYASIEMALEESRNGETIILLNNINENIVIGENKTIIIDLNGKTITNASEEKATITNKGTLTIVDDSQEQAGKIENTKNTAIINDGNLTIGYNDGIIEEHVVVKGETNAIQNNSNFYMYDGTLIAKTTIIGNDAIMPEGEEYGLSIKEENGMQIATIQIIEIPVAQVENMYYTSLQQAIDENNGKTVKIVKDELILSETIKIAENFETVLDLNGKTIESIGNGYVIENSGLLKITDSTQEKTGKIINNNGNGVKNTGELSIENILISTQINTYKVDVYAIYNDSGTFSINSTSIDVKAISQDSCAYAIYNKKTIVNISNSNINAIQNNGSSDYGIYNAESIVTIEESTINVKSSSTYNRAIGINNYNTNLNLSGVEIDVKSRCNGSTGIDNVGDTSVVEIKGGKIRSDKTGIHNSSGTVKINANTINAGSDGLYNGSEAKIEVYGGVIESANSLGIINVGTFNFFGGTIKGKTKAINGSINEIASGKKINQYEENNIKIAKLIDAEQIDVAEIGSTKYTTLEKALLANKENTEEIYIKIIENTEEINIQVAENQNITIDLNGKQLLLYEEIVNKGTLKIIDSSEEKNGNILSKANKIIENNQEGAILDITGITANLVDNLVYGYGIYNSAGTINVKDTNISVEMETETSTYGSYAYGIYNYNGNVNIQKSNISVEIRTSTYNSYAYGIYNKSSESIITLGEKNNSSSEDLTITAKGKSSTNIGIYNPDGILNFYDGIIKAQKNVISGKITEIETGYELYEYIDETDNLNAIRLIEKLPVAKVGESEYFSIQEAVDESMDNKETTIELLRDIKLTETETYIGENKNIILDLRGYTLSATTENTIKNLGTLNIIDTSVGTTGVIENTSNKYYSKIIYNEGTLKVTKGKINANMSELNSRTYGIYNRGEGFVEILGGIITSSGSGDYYGIYNDSTNNVVLNGGIIDIKGKYGCDPVGIYNNSTAKIIVNNAEIRIEGYYRNSTPSCGIINASTGEIEINGGSINIDCTGEPGSDIPKMYGINNASTGTITVKGGNITSNITSSQNCDSYAIYNQSEGIINIENGEVVGIAGKTTNGVYYPKTGYGIYNMGTLNYYGGTIKGTTESIYGEVSSISEGKKISIIQEETIEVAILEEDTPEEIFKVGENTYSELKTAIEACKEENNTIELTKDVILTNSINIGEIVIDKDIVLDLKGFSVKLYNQITNKSNLTIIDSSSEKTGTLESTAIHNESGNLTISDVTILGEVYGIYNNGGNIKVENASINAEIYGIYNIGNIIKQIDIELLGANINSSQYGIYSINKDLSIININVSDSTTITTTSSELSTYGIYNNNNNNGKIVLTIDEESNISAESKSTIPVSYGIYNEIRREGKIEIELLSGTINSKATSNFADAYGIYTSQYYDGKNYSNVKITEGLINVNGHYGDAGGIMGADVEMTGGAIKANSYYKSYGIENSSRIKSNIIITDGVITAFSSNDVGYGVYATKGKVTIGSMDGEVNKLTPDISGIKNGVYISNGAQFDFYDGIIKGSLPIEGTVTNTEPGYKINISTVDSINTATLTKISTADAIAQIGNLYFDDLQKTINACRTGEDTIKILVDINLTRTLNIEEGQTITIDLNGCTIKGTIENNGTLNIINNKGTVGEGSYGTITGTGTINVQ